MDDARYTEDDFGDPLIFLSILSLSFYHSFYLAHEGKAQYQFVHYFCELIWTRCIHITAAFKNNCQNQPQLLAKAVVPVPFFCLRDIQLVG